MGSPSHRTWLIVVSLILGGACGFPSVAATEKATQESAQGDQQAQHVELTIDYGDGVEKRFQALPFKPGLTILGLMDAASQHPRGIKFEYRGQGETAFLKSIDGVANEGRGRNWIFRVNDKLGETSFAVQALRAGDKVAWRFGKYDGK